MTRLLGIAGSLRRESFNKAALRAAQKLVPQGTTLEIFELDGIPPFNQDEEKKAGARKPRRLSPSRPVYLPAKKS